MFLQKLGGVGEAWGVHIYMQINIWELMEPVNAGKFGQSKRMHKDVDTKGENISFPGEDGRKESRQRRELCYSASKGKPGQVRQLAQGEKKEQNKAGKY